MHGNWPHYVKQIRKNINIKKKGEINDENLSPEENKLRLLLKDRFIRLSICASIFFQKKWDYTMSIVY